MVENGKDKNGNYLVTVADSMMTGVVGTSW
jgi:hypothetical protein